MNETSNAPRPEHCFCRADMAKLKEWAVKRYKENRSTIELLNSTNDPEERELIAIVSTLDLAEEYMLQMMSKVDKSNQHIIDCRRKVKVMLRRELGLVFPPHEKAV